MKRRARKPRSRQSGPQTSEDQPTQRDLLLAQAEVFSRGAEIASRKVDALVGIAKALAEAAVPEAFGEAQDHLNDFLQACVDELEDRQGEFEAAAEATREHANQQSDEPQPQTHPVVDPATSRSLIIKQGLSSLD